VKNLKFLPILLIILFSSNSHAVTYDGDITTIDGDTDVKAKKKIKGEDALKGFTLTLDLASTHRLNLEPENAEWVSSYGFKPGYKFGRHFSKNSIFKSLQLEAAFNLSNEIVGNNPRYRTSQFSDPNFFSKDLSYMAISDSVLSRSESDDVDRRVDGADRRIDYSDIVFTLKNSFGKIPVLGVGVNASFSAAVPLSLASINAGLLTKFDYGVGMTRSFKIGGRPLILAYNFVFSHYLYEYETKGIDYLDSSVEINDQEYDTYNYNSATRNNEFAFTNMFSVVFLPIKNVSVVAAYSMLTMRTHDFSQCMYTTPDGSVIDVCASTSEVRGYDDGGRGQRDYQMFVVQAAYNVLPYLNLSLALQSVTPQLKPNSQDYQQPFLSFNRNNYSSVMFKLSYDFDTFYKKVVTK
jgi:hypothetical protein